MTKEEGQAIILSMKEQLLSDEQIMIILYKMFQDDEIDLKKLEELLSYLGKTLSNEFLALDLEQQKKIGLF